MLDNLADDRLHDPVIGVEQIVAAHAGFSRDAGGDDDDVGICRVLVVIGSADVGVPLFDRHGFEQVQTLALWYAFDDVDQDHVAQFFRGNPVSGRCAHVPGPYDGNFLAHKASFQAVVFQASAGCSPEPRERNRFSMKTVGKIL
jgi:hypothetical protein